MFVTFLSTQLRHNLYLKFEVILSKECDKFDICNHYSNKYKTVLLFKKDSFHIFPVRPNHIPL